MSLLSEKVNKIPNLLCWSLRRQWCLVVFLWTHCEVTVCMNMYVYVFFLVLFFYQKLQTQTIIDWAMYKKRSNGCFVGNSNHIPWAPKPTFLEVFMVTNLVFSWPKPLFFMVLGAHGSECVFFFLPWFSLSRNPRMRSTTLPETNPAKLAPEKWMVGRRLFPFFLGFGLFSGASC